MMTDEDLGTVASTRSARKTEDRPKTWTPPNKLETPTPPEGKHYRWVRYSAGGEGDDANVYERARQGYRPVMSDELKDWVGDTIKNEHGDHIPSGTVRQGDLILMEVDVDIVRQRNEYFEQKNRSMQKAVDQELERHGSAHMPIVHDSQSHVSTGNAQQRTNIDDG